MRRRLPVQAATAIEPPATASGIAPLDAVEALAGRIETESLSALAHAPSLPADLWRVLPEGFDPVLRILAPAAGVYAAVILIYLLARRLLRGRRCRAGAERNAFVGLLKLTGLEFLALLAAAATARVLLVRVLGIAPGTAVLPAELTIGLIRWLVGLTVMTVLLQPALPRLRLVAIDDAGARKALWSMAALLAVGHLHVCLLAAAQRVGLPEPSVKLVSCLVGLGMATGAVKLLATLRHHGMKLAPRLLASWLVVGVFALWVWGWTTLDFDLYRGAIGTITVLLLALTLDRAVALSIRESRRPDAMRMLFVARVVVDALAVAVILRIVLDFWVVGTFGWLTPGQWHGFSGRLTFASAMMVLAVALVALIHVWTEMRLTSEAVAAQGRQARHARLSTVLPIVRFSTITLVGVVFSLLALSAVGIDVTALIAGAGIVGLAISFGSQTLVKDIVSGVFYMLDDVFRLGETIEAGGRRGQLERINLRSVRLRDEDGRLHTIPLGDLGTVTNYSRRLVRMSVLVVYAATPPRHGLARLGRETVAALRSESLIDGAIVGDIDVRLNEATDATPGSLALAFNMAATTAERAQALAHRLVEETLANAGMAEEARTIEVTVSDLSGAPDTPPPAPAVETRQAMAVP
jgi:small-conductance mechanosensitive channel